MKIISWNVNGIRALAKKWLSEFLKEYNPDILCLQETKAFEEQVKEELKIFWDYKYIWHIWKKPWYAGTAIFYKKNISINEGKNHFKDIDHFHDDWRITQIEIDNFVLINWYFPNWWQRADWREMLSYKLEFYDHIIRYVNNLIENWKDIIITWDFNISHQEIDLARPKENQESIWFLPIEREKIWELFNNWFVDVWRYLNPNKKDVYSWWSYRSGAKTRNIWWRLDYFVVNEKFLKKVKNMSYLTETSWSDHCPILLEI